MPRFVPKQAKFFNVCTEEGLRLRLTFFLVSNSTPPPADNYPAFCMWFPQRSSVGCAVYLVVDTIVH